MARSFSGTAQYLSIASAILTAVPISFECWYKPTSITTTQVLVSISHSSGGGAGTNRFVLFVDTSGKLNAQSDSANTAVQSTTTTALTNGVWHHCVAVFTSSILRVAYLDGVAATSNTTSSTPGTMDTTSIGMTLGGSGTALFLCSGSIAFTAIRNVALTANDVLALSSGSSPRMVQPQSLVSYARLTGGTSPEPDLIRQSGWTLTGSPTEVSNPRIYEP